MLKWKKYSLYERMEIIIKTTLIPNLFWKVSPQHLAIMGGQKKKQKALKGVE